MFFQNLPYQVDTCGGSKRYATTSLNASGRFARWLPVAGQSQFTGPPLNELLLTLWRGAGRVERDNRIDRPLRLLIPLPVLIRDDQAKSDGATTRYLHCFALGAAPLAAEAQQRSRSAVRSRPTWPLRLHLRDAFLE